MNPMWACLFQLRAWSVASQTFWPQAYFALYVTCLNLKRCTHFKYPKIRIENGAHFIWLVVALTHSNKAPVANNILYVLYTVFIL